MGITEREARRRRKAGVGKEKHPIAAIEKRVIHSAAFADLTPSSVVVLLLMAASLAKGRNGHIQLSEQDAAAHGVERKTFRRALHDLIEHGFIHKTKSGGKVQGHCHKWALTWLEIERREGLNPAYMECFNPLACLEWGKNFQGTKRDLHSAQNVPLKANRSPNLSLTQGTFPTHKTINTNTPYESLPYGAWIAPELDRLAALGLGGHRCFAVHQERNPTCH